MRGTKLRTSPLARPQPATPDHQCAQMAELVDALASGASSRKGVEVRVLFWAPNHGPTGTDKLQKTRLEKVLLQGCSQEGLPRASINAQSLQFRTPKRIARD